MQHLPLYASLAVAALAVIGCLILAAKLAVERQGVIAADAVNATLIDRNAELLTENEHLAGTINAMKSDAAEGRRSREQREQNLRTMQARNAAKNAAKKADGAVSAVRSH
jgi:hypothetical protein